MALHEITREDLIAERLPARQLDLSSRKRVATDLSGTHLSGFRGRGMEFEEHRRYVPGDEIRSIDWRVSARTGQTHVRSYREERERPVLIGLDLRAPMWFGSRGCFKAVLAARAAARYAWAASQNSDRVGGICLSKQIQLTRPAGGRRGVLRLIGIATETKPPLDEPIPPLHELLQELRQVCRPGSLVVVISDFHDLDEQAEQNLILLARHCEIILAMVSDPLERQAPKPGQYPIRSLFKKSVLLNTADKALQQQWSTLFLQRQNRLQNLSMQLRARCLDLRTEQDLSIALEARAA